MVFLDGSDGKESTFSAWKVGSIPGSEIFPGVGNGNSLPYSCLKNPVNRGAWQATVSGRHRVRYDWATNTGDTHTHTHTHTHAYIYTYILEDGFSYLMTHWHMELHFS